MKYLYSLILVLICLSSDAQQLGTAIVFNEKDIKDTKCDLIYNEIYTRMAKEDPGYTEFYSWSGKSSDNVNFYKKFNSKIDTSEQPITTAVYVYTGFRTDKSPTFSTKKDSTGKVIAMTMKVLHPVSPRYKIINLATSELVASHDYRIKPFATSSSIPIRDFKKYFGKEDPEKLKSGNSKLYNTKIKQIKKDYSGKIKDAYKKIGKEVGGSLSNIVGKIKAQRDDHLWKIVDWEKGQKGKLKEFYIDATASENLKKGEILDLYQKRDFGEYSQYDLVSNIGVKEIMADKVMVNTYFYNRKKVKKAIEQSQEIVVSRNESLTRNSNRAIKNLKRVQIKGDCFTCNTYIENVLLNAAPVKVLERNFEAPRNYFTEQYTNEKFMDFQMEDVQGKTEGVEYILESTKDDLKATVVETGRIVKADKGKEKGFFGRLGGVSSAQVLNLCLELFEEEITIIEVTDQKKGKVKRVHAHNPIGFDDIIYLKIVKLIEEKIGDRVLVRKEEIGKAVVKEKFSNSVAELKIKDGKKQLFKAL